jgi:serine/threonine protein kinase
MANDLVLFGSKDLRWKVCDFGLTVDGTSKGFQSSKLGRGTSGYRAPELLKGEYNNKVDVFALGCILFELATGGKKAFHDDFAVFDYTRSRDHSQILLPRSVAPSDRWHTEMQKYISQMMAINSNDRPSASYLVDRFAMNRSLAIAEVCLEEKEYDLAFDAYEPVMRDAAFFDGITWGNIAFAYAKKQRHHGALYAWQKAIEMGWEDRIAPGSES